MFGDLIILLPRIQALVVLTFFYFTDMVVVLGYVVCVQQRWMYMQPVQGRIYTVRRSSSPLRPTVDSPLLHAYVEQQVSVRQEELIWRELLSWEPPLKLPHMHLYRALPMQPKS